MESSLDIWLDQLLFSVCNLSTIILCIQITAEGTKSYDDNFNEIRSLNVTITSAALTDLTPGTLYRITIVAINGAGRGAESEPLLATTLNGTCQYMDLMYLYSSYIIMSF